MSSNRLITAALAASLAIGGIGASGAGAHSFGGYPPNLAASKLSETSALRQRERDEHLAFVAAHRPGDGVYDVAGLDGYATAAPATVPSAAVHGASFDWGDAGIGAAGGLTLAIAGVGAALAVTRQRRTLSSGGSRATPRSPTTMK